MFYVCENNHEKLILQNVIIRYESHQTTHNAIMKLPYNSLFRAKHKTSLFRAKHKTSLFRAKTETSLFRAKIEISLFRGKSKTQQLV